jgi:glutathione S-transferase
MGGRAVLKVWGRASSNNVQKVTWCCDELGVPYERVDAGGNFGGTDTPEYRAMNPNGLVPTVQDGDLTLWESNAIVRYLAARHGEGTLWPEDPAARAFADRWMDWQMGTFWAAFRVAFLGLTRSGFGASPEEIGESLKSTSKALAILDGHLADADYVAGERVTMGDVALGPGVYRWLNVEIERPSLPNLEAWHERLTQRPAYRKNVMVRFTLE